MSALQGDLMIARGLIGGCHRVIVVWGVGLMEHKEELKQQTAALQWNLMIARMLIGGIIELLCSGERV